MSRFRTRFIIETKKADIISLFEKLPEGDYFVDLRDQRMIVGDDDLGISFEIPCGIKYLTMPHSKIRIDHKVLKEMKKHSSDVMLLEGTKFGTFIFGDHNVSIEP